LPSMLQRASLTNSSARTAGAPPRRPRPCGAGAGLAGPVWRRTARPRHGSPPQEPASPSVNLCWRLQRPASAARVRVTPGARFSFWRTVGTIAWSTRKGGTAVVPPSSSRPTTLPRASRASSERGAATVQARPQPAASHAVAVEGLRSGSCGSKLRCGDSCAAWLAVYAPTKG
jgi:hypothetical protein